MLKLNEVCSYSHLYRVMKYSLLTVHVLFVTITASIVKYYFVMDYFCSCVRLIFRSMRVSCMCCTLYFL